MVIILLLTGCTLASNLQLAIQYESLQRRDGALVIILNIKYVVLGKNKIHRTIDTFVFPNVSIVLCIQTFDC